jgi:hypothetical protein
MGRDHINKDGLFQSDKYPACPPGKVPLSTKDPMAQDLLWQYAQRRRVVDAEFSADLEECLKRDGYQTPLRAAPARELLEAVEWAREHARSCHIVAPNRAAYLNRLANAAERPAGEVTLSAAATDVLAERKRQVEAEGWTIEHDDRHPDGELAVAAACYAAHERLSDFALVREIFPWRDE